MKKLRPLKNRGVGGGYSSDCGVMLMVVMVAAVVVVRLWWWLRHHWWWRRPNSDGGVAKVKRERNKHEKEKRKAMVSKNGLDMFSGNENPCVIVTNQTALLNSLTTVHTISFINSEYLTPSLCFSLHSPVIHISGSSYARN